MVRNSILRLLQAVTKGRWHLLSGRHAEAPLGPGDGLFYPIQRHTVPELAMITRGACQIYAEETWQRLAAEMMLAFLPGAWHTEKWVEPGTSYTMLWLTLLPQGVNLHFSAYSPQTGYHLAGERLTFQVPSAASLWEASTHPDLTDNIPAQAHFLSQLLQSLVEVLDGLENPAESPLPYAQQLAEQVKHYLDAHFRSDVTLQALAEMVHYSPAHLNAVFRRHVGSPIHRYLLDQRLKHAKKLLAQPGSSIKQAARESGFNDPLYFSRLFRRRTGVNPREFQLQLREQRT